MVSCVDDPIVFYFAAGKTVVVEVLISVMEKTKAKKGLKLHTIGSIS